MRQLSVSPAQGRFGPSQLSIGQLIALPLLAMLAAQPAAAAPLPDQLEAGLVRFQLMLGEPLTALAINPQPDSRDQRLLQAQALSDLGLYDKARTELEALAAGHSQVSAQAGLELVRLNLKTENLERAQHWLDETLPLLAGDDLQEGLFRQAELMRQRGDLSAAAAVLGEMGSGDWTSMGYYNLAAAYAERDQSRSRPLVALRVAAATVGDRPSSAGAEMVDLSHLAGGVLALQEDDPEKAVGFLSKVRLESYQAPRALYLHGLAHFKQDNVRGALQSWHRARKFPLAFPGAPESYIAMGQGFDEAGASAQAADAFVAAKAAFEKEQVVLGELERSVQEKGGYEALITASRQNDVEWFLDNSQAVTAPRLAWLMRFMEDAQAQDTVKRLADIMRMDRRLAQKQVELGVMRDSLARRIEEAGAIQTGSKASQLEALKDRMSALRQRAEELQARYEEAVAHNRTEALVSGEMADRFAQLHILQQAAVHHGEPEVEERVRRLRGLTLWEAQAGIEHDRAGLEESLGRVQTQIEETADKLGRFTEKAREVPGAFRKFLARADAAAAEAGAQRKRLDALRARSDQALTAQVLAFLETQKTELALLADRSEQEIAHLYEYMAVSRLRAGESGEGAR